MKKLKSIRNAAGAIEVIEVDLTPEEIAQREADAAAFATRPPRLPAVQDQLDAIWNWIATRPNPPAMLAEIQQIKAANPLPE